MIKRFLPRSLFTRTLLILLIPTVLVQIVTTYVFYDRHWETLARRLTGSLGGDIAYVAHILNDAPISMQKNILEKAEQDLHMQFDFVPLEAMELPTAPQINSLVDQLLYEELDQRLDNQFYATVNADPDRVKIIVQLDNGFLIVYANKKRLFSYTTRLVIIWMVGSSVLLLGIAAIFLRNQIRPIRKLAIAAEKLGKGQEAGDLKPSGSIEIRQATAAFGIMRDRIRRQIQQRTDMLSGISHDLRTPLTRLKLELALLPSSPDIQAMQGDVDEMRQMVETYLDFARGDAEEESQTVSIPDLLDEIVRDFARDGKQIQYRPDGAVEISGRRNALKRCIGNLLGNACRYAKNVWITAEIGARGVRIEVSDDGPGIPPEMREEVFKPFRRLDDSRNSETGGVGLGLSIARDIARNHGGDITLDKAKQGGLSATLYLPL
ncbi:MAG: HAMP domain-containing protein [Alphaproteobacteria bacterium]|nr:MAG: HAMP domain-containing protein [Alphaproteobacteria bacterium]